MTADSSSVTVTAPAVKGVAHRHQAVLCFLLGLFVSLVLYTIISGQFGPRNTIVVLQSTPGEGNEKYDRTSSPPLASPASSVPNDSTQGNVQANRAHQSDQTVNDASDKIEGDLDQTVNGRNADHGAPRKPICDLSDPRYDICEILGDARAIGINRTVLYVPPADERDIDGSEWAIKDQSRKILVDIIKVKVKTLSAAESLVAPECTSRHDVPAVVFAMNGLTYNPWHALADVLVPLFITTRAYDGEVQFLVTEIQPSFVDKYRLIFANLSRYEIIDFNKDAGVRCYPHIVVGLRSHRELGIDPARTPRNYTMLDFRLYMRDIFSLPPDGLGIPYKVANKKNAANIIDNDSGNVMEKQKPRLMLIKRGGNRKFVNVPEIAAAVEAAGFEVLVVDPHDLKLEEFSRVVDSCDVLMGAHGAALTYSIFLRTNAAMVQVVPWGVDTAMVYFGDPAKEWMLQDIEYEITAEESTLYEKYGKDHPAVKDPESIHKQGWELMRQYYWLEQDIRINVTRFSSTLHQLLHTLGE